MKLKKDQKLKMIRAFEKINREVDESEMIEIFDQVILSAVSPIIEEKNKALRRKLEKEIAKFISATESVNEALKILKEVEI